MEFPTIIHLSGPYPLYGLMGGIFHFYSNFNRTFCKQTVETLIRHSVMRRLMWVCIVCLCPTKRTLARLIWVYDNTTILQAFFSPDESMVLHLDEK